MKNLSTIFKLVLALSLLAIFIGLTSSVVSAQVKPSYHIRETDHVKEEYVYRLLLPRHRHRERHLPTSTPSVYDLKSIYKPGVHYLVSLGGSIAAGAGLSPRYDSAYPRYCEQSDASYAHIMAARLGLVLDQVACSRATTGHGILGAQEVRDKRKEYLLPSQISTTSKEIKVSLVTLFIGANDVRWIQFEYHCLLRGCSTRLPKHYEQGLTAITDGVKSILSKVRLEGPKAIIVDQYYSAFSGSGHSVTGHCSLAHLSQSSLAIYGKRLAQLNQAIAKGVDIKGVILVKPNFSGHGLCSADPWVQSIDDRMPFHPTASGQKELADENLSNLKSSHLSLQ